MLKQCLENIGEGSFHACISSINDNDNDNDNDNENDDDQS